MRRKLPNEGRIVGGCPCRLWSAHNCAYTQAVGLCRAPHPERPVTWKVQDRHVIAVWPMNANPPTTDSPSIQLSDTSSTAVEQR